MLVATEQKEKERMCSPSVSFLPTTPTKSPDQSNELDGVHSYQVCSWQQIEGSCQCTWGHGCHPEGPLGGIGSEQPNEFKDKCKSLYLFSCEEALKTVQTWMGDRFVEQPLEILADIELGVRQESCSGSEGSQQHPRLCDTACQLYKWLSPCAHNLLGCLELLPNLGLPIGKTQIHWTEFAHIIGRATLVLSGEAEGSCFFLLE